MKSLVVTLLFLSTVCLSVSAQKMEGEITYERVFQWTNIYAKMDFLSNEEKERMKLTYKNFSESKKDMTLFFKDNKSYYAEPKEKEANGGYSWNEQEFKVYRDFSSERRTDIIEMIGKTYIVEDSLKVPQWKIMNKIKEIGGYMCMMAVTEDTIKKQKITAWFADNLPISAGPELYFGLPGLILELDFNDGDLVVAAKKIELKAVAENLTVPAKLKGKRINFQQYNKIVWTQIAENKKARRYTYNFLQY